MTETKKTEKPPLWAMLLDPKKPGASMLLYKGEPMGLVQDMKVGVEILPGAKKEHVIHTVLSLKVLVQDLALGTFDSEASAEKAKEAVPAQGELPLFEKKA